MCVCAYANAERADAKKKPLAFVAGVSHPSSRVSAMSSHRCLVSARALVPPFGFGNNMATAAQQHIDKEAFTYSCADICSDVRRLAAGKMFSLRELCLLAMPNDDATLDTASALNLLCPLRNLMRDALVLVKQKQAHTYQIVSYSVTIGYSVPGREEGERILRWVSAADNRILHCKSLAIARLRAAESDAMLHQVEMHAHVRNCCYDWPEYKTVYKLLGRPPGLKENKARSLYRGTLGGREHLTRHFWPLELEHDLRALGGARSDLHDDAAYEDMCDSAFWHLYDTIREQHEEFVLRAAEEALYAWQHNKRGKQMRRLCAVCEGPGEPLEEWTDVAARSLPLLCPTCVSPYFSCVCIDELRGVVQI